MIEHIRKVGLITKGVIYALVGVLTLSAALGLGGQIAGKNGVIDFLENQRFGQIILILIGLGLAGYAVWRMCSAFLDTKNEGQDEKAYAKRTGYFISGLVYAGLGYSTLRNGFTGHGSSGSSKDHLASILLRQSWGEMAMYLIAAILLGVGIYQFYKGLQKKFLQDINRRGRVESRELLEKSGRFGFIARGVSFLIFAWFTFNAASQGSALEIRGLEGVFTYLQDLPLGNILMALLALGFVAYGVYQYFLARYSTLYW